MKIMNFFPKIYTVESVTSGHPDKMCDQIADGLLDAYLEKDPSARVAIEILGSHNLMVLSGEVTSKIKIDSLQIAQKIYKEIGYVNKLNIIQDIAQQSPDIARGVDTGGAGDQGIMYGYATNETPEFLPKGVVLVHKLARGLEDLRKNDQKFSWLRPDGKTQITIVNNEIKTILISCQHNPDIEQREIREYLINGLLKPMNLWKDNLEFLINPTGKFVTGGFASDTGVTGRKIIIDTYCGLAPHGGGSFSGKDPTKVDRSGAYMARFAAKNIVANGLAKECLVSIAYAIGRVEPLMVGALNEKGENLSDSFRQKFDFRPLAIIERLNLRRPIYFQTACYGHFGKPDLPWEEIIKI